MRTLTNSTVSTANQTRSAFQRFLLTLMRSLGAVAI